MDMEQEMQRLRYIEEQYNKLLNSHLSLRDHFAASVLPSIWTRINTELEEGNINGTEFLSCVSRAAYEVADGMLKERSREHNK